VAVSPVTARVDRKWNTDLCRQYNSGDADGNAASRVSIARLSHCSGRSWDNVPKERNPVGGAGRRAGGRPVFLWPRNLELVLLTVTFHAWCARWFVPTKR
jgi:hypothetical protein